jgi:hypothetical protein
MKIELEDFKTGWYGITCGLKSDQIDSLINRLKELKENHGHFHFRSNYKGAGGVGDIEFYWEEDGSPDNMGLDDFR